MKSLDQEDADLRACLSDGDSLASVQTTNYELLHDLPIEKESF